MSVDEDGDSDLEEAEITVGLAHEVKRRKENTHQWDWVPVEATHAGDIAHDDSASVAISADEDERMADATGGMDVDDANKDLVIAHRRLC
jgi:hypothetical protein